MRWVKRGLWVAAWSFWAWLGFGLYRELPRDLALASVVRPSNSTTLQLINPLGFVGDTDRFAVVLRNGKHLRSFTEIRVYDGATGEVVLQVPGPAYGDLLGDKFFSPCDGSLFAAVSPDNSEAGLFRLDLESGKWHCITTNREVAGGAVHPSWPWILFSERREDKGEVGRFVVVVVDWKSGKEIFARPIPLSITFPGRGARFADDEYRVAIPLRRKGGAQDDRCWEIWRVGKPAGLEAIIEDAPIGPSPSFAAGRVAFSNPLWTSAVEVCDFAAANIVFTNMLGEQRPPLPSSPADWRAPAVLSRSGRRVLGGDPSTLWDVDSGAVVWRASNGALAFGGPQQFANKGFFGVVEQWDVLWKDWLSKFEYHTFAIRDLETSRLKFRVGPTKAKIAPSYWNAAETLAADQAGNVYRVPARVNYPLLALCQTILALPLILLWVLLRWHRKRRLRLASVAS